MNLSIRPARLSDADVVCEFNRLLAKETENKELDLATLKPGVIAVLSDASKGRYLVAASANGSVWVLRTPELPPPAAGGRDGEPLGPSTGPADGRTDACGVGTTGRSSSG